jgi:hypothetical protein
MPHGLYKICNSKDYRTLSIGLTHQENICEQFLPEKVFSQVVSRMGFPKI